MCTCGVGNNKLVKVNIGTVYLLLPTRCYVSNGRNNSFLEPARHSVNVLI